MDWEQKRYEREKERLQKQKERLDFQFKKAKEALDAKHGKQTTYSYLSLEPDSSNSAWISNKQIKQEIRNFDKSRIQISDDLPSMNYGTFPFEIWTVIFDML